MNRASGIVQRIVDEHPTASALVFVAGMIAVVFLVVSAIVAVLLAPPIFANLRIDPATAASLRAAAATSSTTAAENAKQLPSLGQWLTDLIPINPIKTAADGNMLPLVIFSVLFSAAATRTPTETRDTIVRRDAWGSSALPRTWIASVNALRRHYPRGRYYWLLITSGYRTYRFLPLFWRNFAPCFDEPTPMREWLPAYAEAVGAKPPRRVPAWLARLAGGPAAGLAAEQRGASNAKAREELGWTPRYPSWREGFRVALG